MLCEVYARPALGMYVDNGKNKVLSIRSNSFRKQYLHTLKHLKNPPLSPLVHDHLAATPPFQWLCSRTRSEYHIYYHNLENILDIVEMKNKLYADTVVTPPVTVGHQTEPLWEPSPLAPPCRRRTRKSILLQLENSDQNMWRQERAGKNLSGRRWINGDLPPW